jgi:predicted porin
MKNRLLPAIHALLLAGGLSVAHADVSIFGYLGTGSHAAGPDGDNAGDNLRCSGCADGFSGSEDLHNGRKAIISLDFQSDTTDQDTDDSLSNREPWLGLPDGFGSVRVGTLSTVSRSRGALIDPLYRGTLQGRERSALSGFLQGAGENSDLYDNEPDAIYTLDSVETGSQDNDPYGVGINYTHGGFLAFADYADTFGSSSAAAGDSNAWKVGGKYARGMFSFYGQYEDSSITRPLAAQTVNYELTGWHLGASATLGNTMANFAYGQGAFDFSEGPRDDYTSWTLVLTHNLNKRTQLYTGFSEIDCDVRVAGAAACGQAGNTGGENNKYSIGMKHRF